jgi:hypothetical protein
MIALIFSFDGDESRARLKDQESMQSIDMDKL